MRRRPNWRRSRSMSRTAGIPEEALMKMAKLGAVIDGWMKTGSRDHQRRAVLDLDGRILRRGALHHHEHDEQRPHPVGLRSRCSGHAEHVHAGPGERNAVGAARLEQQLRQRSQQVRVLPLLQSAQALLQGREDGLPGDHRRHSGQAEYVRHLRGPREGRAR